MAKYYKGHSVNDVWLEAASDLKMKSKNELPIPSRCGNTVETLHVNFTIEAPHERFLFCRKPNISIAVALSELICILKGSNDAKIMNYWNKNLPDFAGTDKKYYGAYGFRLKKEFGINQLKRVYNILKSNIETRQAVLLIWKPSKDLPKEDGKPRNNDIPCNIVSMLKIRDNKLFWSQIMRSNDIFLGTPYNFIQFTFLQEILAGWLKVKIGEYTLFCDSLHYYESNFNIDLYKPIPNEKIENNDYFSETYDETMSYVKYIYSVMKKIAYKKLSEDGLSKIFQKKELPTRWENIILILIAYAAKEYGYTSLKEKLIADIKNPAYIYLWRNHF